MAQPKAVNTASQDTQDNIEQLSEQIAILRQDITAISRSLADIGASTKDAAVESARLKAAEFRASGEELGQQAVDAVRKQPAAAVGMAVGMGFILGFLTGRK
jgi:ElaB/YqjD/DUF883 family membrane-anchored ribosome-binding protein